MRTLIRAGDGSYPEYPRMTHVTDPAKADTSQALVGAPDCLSGCTGGPNSMASRMSQIQS